MIVQDGAVIEGPVGTVVAAELLRREILGAIERHQAGIEAGTEGLQVTVAIQPLTDLSEQGKDGRGGHRVQQITDLVIRRNLVDPEQTVRIVPPQSALHPTLVIQKGGTLGEEHRKGAQGGVLHAIPLVVTAAPAVGKLPKGRAYPLNQGGGSKRWWFWRKGKGHRAVPVVSEEPMLIKRF